MKHIVRGKKKPSQKTDLLNACFYLSPDDLYTGYINKEIHEGLYKLDKRTKRS
jgi:hypothetical protein